MSNRHHITCHILDTTRGKPAAHVRCEIYRIENLEGISEYATSSTKPFGRAQTDSDGRITNWTINGIAECDDNKPSFLTQSTSASDDGKWEKLVPGIYKIKFETKDYFKKISGKSEENSPSSRTFFPFVEVSFVVEDPPDNHYHIPLLLSNHSYSTYRGS